MTVTASRYGRYALRDRETSYAHDVRVNFADRKVAPTCWFVKGFIDRNPEYQGLTH